MSCKVVNMGCIFSPAPFCVYSSKYKYIYDQFLLISVANARCWLLLFKANRCFRMFWLWFPLLYNYQIPVSPKWAQRLLMFLWTIRQKRLSLSQCWQNSSLQISKTQDPRLMSVDLLSFLKILVSVVTQSHSNLYMKGPWICAKQKQNRLPSMFWLCYIGLSTRLLNSVLYSINSLALSKCLEPERMSVCGYSVNICFLQS